MRSDIFVYGNITFVTGILSVQLFMQEEQIAQCMCFGCQLYAEDLETFLKYVIFNLIV